MAYIKQNISALADFLPEGAFEMVEGFFQDYPIQLKITQERKSKLGDYYYDQKTKRHHVSVNGNLNPFQFLITLIHELAHLLVRVQYPERVAPHGQEWKQIFSKLLQPFIRKNIFPQDIQTALTAHLNNVKSTQCNDPVLYQTLRSYDEDNYLTVSHIGVGNIFYLENGEQFKVIEKKRTRYVCRSLKNNQLFLFPGLYEVHSEAQS